MSLFDETPEPDAIRAAREARINALVDNLAIQSAPKPETTPDSEARALLARMLAEGATFQILREADDDVLLWFGSAATVTAEVRAEVTRLKPEIVRLFRGGHPQSRRTWGRP
jgi:hypothetical protein